MPGAGPSHKSRALDGLVLRVINVTRQLDWRVVLEADEGRRAEHDERQCDARRWAAVDELPASEADRRRQGLAVHRRRLGLLLLHLPGGRRTSHEQRLQQALQHADNIVREDLHQ